MRHIAGPGLATTTLFFLLLSMAFADHPDIPANPVLPRGCDDENNSTSIHKCAVTS